jgi:hypothetical protein
LHCITNERSLERPPSLSHRQLDVKKAII